MDAAQQIILAINGLCLVAILYLSGIMISAGAKYTLNVGDQSVQMPLRRRILVCVLIVITIGLIMAITNLISPYL